MSNLLKSISFAVLILFFYSFSFFNSGGKYRIKKVVIDAGHGGKDPGALGKMVKEKDIALSIALKLGKYIKENIPDVEVIYTRKTDKFIELHRRSEIANENNADLFISIHVNASKYRYITGTSTYVMGLNKADENLELVKRENSVILNEKNYKKNYKGFDPNSPETHIVMSLYQNAYLDQSILLADKVQNQFKNRAGRKNRGVWQAGLVVLWNCTMPGILIETGFITNSEEEKYLSSDYGQSIIASAVYRAFKEYKNKMENRKHSEIINESNNKTEFKADNNAIIYKLQISFSKNKLSVNPRNFKGIINVKRTDVSGKYRYTVGNTNSYQKIIKLQKEIRKKIPDAFVIGYKNGVKVKLNLEQ